MGGAISATLKRPPVSSGRGSCDSGPTWMLGEEVKDKPVSGSAVLAFRNGSSNRVDSFADLAGYYRQKFETELTVGILMNLLKFQALLKGDPTSCGGGDVAEVSYEEHLAFIHAFPSNAFQFAR